MFYDHLLISFGGKEWRSWRADAFTEEDNPGRLAKMFVVLM